MTVASRSVPSWRDVFAEACVGALSLLLPVWCAGCDAPDTVLCAPCRELLAPRARRRAIEADVPVFSAVEFAGVPARVIRAFKEDGRTALARPLGAALAVAVAAASAHAGAPAAIVPIPSSRRAFRRRGYEIAALLARRGGLQPLAALTATGTAGDQRGLGRVERARNVVGSLRAHGVEGRDVIVVDDVVTTGATLGEAARALSAGGARVVAAATVTATPRHAR